LVLALSLTPAVLTGCGGDAKKDPAVPTVPAPKTIDGDPLALLPGGALAVARVDFDALKGREMGKAIAKMADERLALHPDSGFLPSRDITRAYIGSYSLQGLDVLGVVSGTFNEAKFRQLAEAKTELKSGGALATAPYAERIMYTTKGVSFAFVSEKLALIGTEAAVRRGLDRIRDKAIPTRSVDPMMQEVVDSPKTDFAVAADFRNAPPLRNLSFGPLSITGLQGLQVVRVLGDFKSPGLNVAATLTYAGDGDAEAGVKGLTKLEGLVRGLSKLAPVPKLQGFAAKGEGKDVQTKFACEDAELVKLVEFLPTLLER
jgi:hypothetical protein